MSFQINEPNQKLELAPFATVIALSGEAWLLFPHSFVIGVSSLQISTPKNPPQKKARHSKVDSTPCFSKCHQVAVSLNVIGGVLLIKPAKTICARYT